MQEKINKDMTFGEVIDSYPDTIPVMAEYGLHCIGCHIATTETIREGAMAHGFDDEMLKNLLTDMNKRVA